MTDFVLQYKQYTMYVIFLYFQSGSYSSLSSDDSRRHSTPPHLTTTKDDNFILRTSGILYSNSSSPCRTGNGSSYSGETQKDFNSAIHLPSASSPSTIKQHAPPAPEILEENKDISIEKSSDNVKPIAAPSFQAFITSSPISSFLSSSYSHLHFPVALGHTVNLSKDEPTNVEDALHSLMTTLEDYHGQYRELEKLEDVVVMLEQILRVKKFTCINLCNID
jgi:hypothetical protein